MHPEMVHLSQLPVSERVELAQDLWNSIAESGERLSIHDWQRELVRARLVQQEGKEEETGLSPSEVWKMVDKRRGL